MIDTETKSMVIRPQLGNSVPIELYRELRLYGISEGLKEIAGRGALALINKAGNNVGKKISANILNALEKYTEDRYLSSVTEYFEKMSIGYMSIEKINNYFYVKIEECVNCYGHDNIGKTICDFEGGVISGIFENYYSKKSRTNEIECCANGNDACLFNVKFF